MSRKRGKNNRLVADIVARLRADVIFKARKVCPHVTASNKIKMIYVSINKKNTFPHDLLHTVFQLYNFIRTHIEKQNPLSFAYGMQFVSTFEYINNNRIRNLFVLVVHKPNQDVISQ